MRLSLTQKLMIPICAMIVCSMLLFAYFTVQNMRNLLIAGAVTDADKLSDTIIRATHYQMLKNDRPEIYRMISEVGTLQSIQRIRLISKDGTTIYSTDSKEIGTRLDKKAAACTMCHASGTPLIQTSSMNRSRFYSEANGTEVLGLTKAIYNDQRCASASCHVHPADIRVLGVLDVTVSLDSVHRQLHSFQIRTVLITLTLMFLITVITTLFFRSVVMNPVSDLLQHTSRVAQGEMNHRVPVCSDNELCDLARSFNEMTERLQHARMELEVWATTMERKVEERTNELKLVQAKLVRSEKLVSLGQLVAGIAHEINNPLTGILVYASLIRDDARLHPELQSDLTTVVRETERCAQIVRRLLEFSRESIPQKSWTDLGSIMDTALTLVMHQSLFQDITLVKLYDPAPSRIHVDQNQIEQVFINILINGGQAMPNGGTMTIAIGQDDERQQAFARVSDTGYGIPADILEKIFDPFFTTKEVAGTGLGLSVSFGIIENHGGTIEVESAEGKGTTFTILLPIQADGTTVQQ